MTERASDVPHVEIVLDGHNHNYGRGHNHNHNHNHGHGHGHDQPDRPHEPGARRFAAPTPAGLLIALMALVAVTLAVVSAVLFDDGAGAPPVATIDPDELAAAITVPPTLAPRPVETSPAATPATATPAPEEGGLDRARLVAASVETLPPLTGTTVPQPDTFRLSDGSLTALDAPVARRSVTDHTIGAAGFNQTVTIINDPTAGRYRIDLVSGAQSVRVIVDVPGGTTYIETAPDDWATEPNDVIAERTGAPDIETFLRNLQLGPIRSDTRDAWTLVQDNPLVAGTRGEPQREWLVVIDASAVPEWARYAFGPGADAAPLPLSTLIGYAVYVGPNGSIRRVTGETEYGATVQRIIHRIDELDEPPVIELPAVADLSDEPVAGTG